jgi:hypothetical protein
VSARSPTSKRLADESLNPSLAPLFLGALALVRDDHDRLDAWTLFRRQRAAHDDKLAALGLHSFDAK